jgi:hypothetical protein
MCAAPSGDASKVWLIRSFEKNVSLESSARCSSFPVVGPMPSSRRMPSHTRCSMPRPIQERAELVVRVQLGDELMDVPVMPY